MSKRHREPAAASVVAKSRRSPAVAGAAAAHDPSEDAELESHEEVAVADTGRKETEAERSAQATVSALAAMAEQHAAGDREGEGAEARGASDARQTAVKALVERLMNTPSRYTGPPLPMPSATDDEMNKICGMIHDDPLYIGRQSLDDTLTLDVYESKAGSSVTLTLQQDHPGRGRGDVEFITDPVVSRFLRLMPFGNRKCDWPDDKQQNFLATEPGEMAYCGTLSEQVCCESSREPGRLGIEVGFDRVSNFLESLRKRIAALVWKDPRLRERLAPYWRAKCEEQRVRKLEVLRMFAQDMELPPAKREELKRYEAGVTERDVEEAFMASGVISPATVTEKRVEFAGSTATRRYYNIKVRGPVVHRTFSLEAKNGARATVESSNEPLLKALYHYRDKDRSFGFVPEPMNFYASPSWNAVVNRHKARAILAMHPNPKDGSFVMAWRLVVRVALTAKTLPIGAVRMELAPRSVWCMKPFVNVQRHEVVMTNPLARMSASGGAASAEDAGLINALTADEERLLQEAEEMYAGKTQ